MQLISLRFKFLLFITLFFIVSMIGAYGSLHNLFQQNLISQGERLAEKQVLYDLSRSIRPLERELILAQKLSTSPVIQNWAQDATNLKKKEQAITELESFRLAFADKSYFLGLKSTGNYYYNNRENQYAGDQLRYQLKKDNRQNSWFFKTLEQPKNCLLNVDYDEELDTTKIWINCLVRVDDEAVAVVGSGVDLSSYINDVIRNRPFGITNLFVDTTGAIQAYPEKSLIDFRSISKSVDQRKRVFNLIDQADQKTNLEETFKNLLNKDHKVATLPLTIKGIDYIAGVTFDRDIGWFLITLIEIDSLSTFKETNFTIFLFAIFLGLFLTLSWLLLKFTILDRVIRLDRLAKQAAKGDYNIPLHDHGRDEIGRLASEFHLMGLEINQHTGKLQSAVEKSTEELRLEFEQHKKTAKKIEENEYRYRQMFEGNSAIKLLIDPEDGRIVDANSAASEFYGYPLETLLGMKIDNINILDSDSIKEEIEKAKAQARKYFLFQHKLSSGEIRDVEVYTGPIINQDKTYLYSIVFDITERNRAQKKLRASIDFAEAANQAKSEFLANMSHEIRTPMNVILGLTKVVLDSPLEADDKENLEIVVSAGDSLLNILNDILDLSKIESGKLDIVAVPFDLKIELDSIFESFDTKATEKGLNLTLEIAANSPNILQCDSLRLRQILVNLIANAIKFTKIGQVKLNVEASKSKEGVNQIQFAISDTGIGIDSDKQEHIFESFTQADSTTTRHFGGTGLGLSICKKLVDLMGGELWLTSVKGEGSTFFFTLPASSPVTKN